MARRSHKPDIGGFDSLTATKPNEEARRLCRASVCAGGWWLARAERPRVDAVCGDGASAR
jgi:hypothetical protein